MLNRHSEWIKNTIPTKKKSIWLDDTIGHVCVHIYDKRHIFSVFDLKHDCQT